MEYKIACYQNCHRCKRKEKKPIHNGNNIIQVMDKANFVQNVNIGSKH